MRLVFFFAIRLSLSLILSFFYFFFSSWFEQSALTADKNKLRKLLEKVDHGAIAYEPFRKDFYTEAPDITRMTDIELKTCALTSTDDG